MTHAGHFVRYDQVMFGVDRGLHVVAHHAGSAPAGGHGARIGVRQRHLLVRRGLDLLLHRLQGLHLLAQAGDLVLDAGGPGLGDVAVFAVSPVQGRQVARDAGVDLLQALGDLGHGEVPVAVVHRLELAAVDGDHRPREQAQLPA